MLRLFDRLDPERRREVLFSASLLGLVVVGALGGEALLRLREVVARPTTVDWFELRADILYYDAEAGFDRFIPGAQSGNISVNALALPGPEVSVPKPQGTLRLAFLGDSVMLAASVAQDRTPSALITAAVAEAFPDCRVDYVTVAGPSFDLKAISGHLSDLDRGVDPDAFVLLSSSPREVLAKLESEVGADPPYITRTSGLSQHSLLWQKVGRARSQVAVSLVAGPGELLSRIDLDRFAQTHRELLEPIADHIGPAPAVVIIERNRTRPGMSQIEVSTINRALLSSVDGLTLEGLSQLEATMTRVLADVSAEHGWQLLDALAEVPPDSVHYEDEVHLTEAGVSRLVAAVSGPLRDEIAADPPDCAGGHGP